MDEYAKQLGDQIADRKDRHVSRLIGLEFRQDISVRIRKPKYMPDWLYRRLMRTIVIQEGPLIFGKPR